MDDELEEIRRRKKQELLERMSGESGSKTGSGAPEAPVDLSDQTMDQAVAKYPLLVVDCWAAWCGPCKMIAPVVEELAKKYRGRIVFGKLNVDQNQSTSVKYRIMSIPALLVFKNGKHVDTVIGYMPAAALEQKLLRYL